jgi:hypothetical protein
VFEFCDLFEAGKDCVSIGAVKFVLCDAVAMKMKVLRCPVSELGENTAHALTLIDATCHE